MMRSWRRGFVRITRIHLQRVKVSHRRYRAKQQKNCAERRLMDDYSVKRAAFYATKAAESAKPKPSFHDQCIKSRVA